MEDRLISCPKDAEPMHRITLGAVAIDRCPACGGVWLDTGELRALKHTMLEDQHRRTIEQLDALGTEEPAHRPEPLLCPRDHARMSVHRDPRQPHVELDVCTKCGGMFFDAGELADLSELTLGERLRRLLG
jgi:Zn-finger nucleic acid-binding protein